jgi:RNA polymerase sigma-70 factor (ECF subfamily)
MLLPYLPSMVVPSAYDRLIASFLAGADVEPPGYLGPALAAACDEGRRAWSGIDVDDTAFCRFLGERFAVEELAPAGDPLRISDLYLACACTLGTGGASEQLVTSCGDTVRSALARVAEPADQPEVMQQVWQSLLVATPDRAPKIAQYKGRGPIAAFVRVAAVRLAMSSRRKQRPAIADELEILRIADDVDDPELQYLKRLYKAEFQHSFGVAFAALTPAYQLLIRLDVVDQLTIDEAALVYGRSRTTTGRHLLEARQALARGTLEDLQRRLDLAPSDLDSLARLIRSQIDLSVQQLLIDAG